MNKKPALFTSFSPALIHFYDIRDSIVVIIDILRATSTITTALFNGARAVIPVDSVSACIETGKLRSGITAGERDGRIAEGLSFGNSPFEYPRDFIDGKILVLTTTNGTKLLHMALANGADEIVIGAFTNIDALCRHLIVSKKNVLLGCAAWKDRINLEDSLFAGAVIARVKEYFEINCDSSHMAESIYQEAAPDLFGFLEKNEASHFLRLINFGLEKDIRYCLTNNGANVLPVYRDGELTVT